MSQKFWTLTVLLLFATCGFAEEGETGTNLVNRIREHVSIHASADVETAYLARGAVVDSHPFSSQLLGGDILLDDFGHIGAFAWSASSFTRTGQRATRRNAYHEVDYNIYYGYRLKLADEWTLDNRMARQWVTLPGYRPHANTFCEWHAAQSLETPYVTPYYLLRHCCQPDDWNYWDVGVKRTFSLTDTVSFTLDFFGDLGDSRHFAAQYGPKPSAPRSKYHGGLQALNLVARTDWKLTDYLSVFAFVWQFDIVSDDARDSLGASNAPEAKRDVTVGGIGLAVNF
ncbi:MAG: hypothetical protein IKR48_06740 [Kiritimatiellae bacterium]|nr:hypothetical protein [Kiritimatiellia bacterium]